MIASVLGEEPLVVPQSPSYDVRAGELTSALASARDAALGDVPSESMLNDKACPCVQAYTLPSPSYQSIVMVYTSMTSAFRISRPRLRLRFSSLAPFDRRRGLRLRGESSFLSGAVQAGFRHSPASGRSCSWHVAQIALSRLGSGLDRPAEWPSIRRLTLLPVCSFGQSSFEETPARRSATSMSAS